MPECKTEEYNGAHASAPRKPCGTSHQSGTEPAMQAIEFEAVTRQHMLRVPDTVPDGAKVRVLVLIESPLDTAGRSSEKRNLPSPRLAGSVKVSDDLIAPAASADEWDATR